MVVMASREQEPQPLPLLAECRLDLAGLRRQRDRYATLGRDLVGMEREPGRLIATFSEHVDDGLVRETIEVERECCPFFELAYDAAGHRLSITVEEPVQDPALDALQYSLRAPRP
jgi:hypothetical protein